MPTYIELTESVATVALGDVGFVLRWIILTVFAPIWGDDEAGWRVAEAEISFRKTGQWERLYGKIPYTIGWVASVGVVMQFSQKLRAAG